MSNLAPVRARLESCALARPSTGDSFSRRLARENGWSRAHTARVLAEYKRFLVLASTSERIVCPSDDVDQAWHLHILHTRDYRRFCRTLLGRRLDHTPSRGGMTERLKYAEAYEHTLDAYRRAFGEDPPSDVWPTVAGRFNAERELVRLDVNSHWVIPKPRFVRRATTLFTELTSLRPRALAALAALAATGCVSDGSDGAWHVSGPTFLGLYLTGWVGSLAAASYAKYGNPLREERTRPELDGYEAAYLSGEGVAAVDAAIAMLIVSGAASFDSATEQLRALGPLAPGAHPLEAAIYARLSTSTPVLIGEVRGEAQTLTAGSAERLKTLGLITDRPSRLPLALALAAPVVGIGRIVSRIGTAYPIGLLVLLTVLGFIVAFWAFRASSFLTERGRRVLKALKSEHQRLPRSGSPTALAANGMLPLAVGLFGFSVLEQGTELDSLRSWMQKPPAQAGGGGCGGGGCGGGECGGGCGGCGGCGE